MYTERNVAQVRARSKTTRGEEEEERKLFSAGTDVRIHGLRNALRIATFFFLSRLLAAASANVFFALCRLTISL